MRFGEVLLGPPQRIQMAGAGDEGGLLRLVARAGAQARHQQADALSATGRQPHPVQTTVLALLWGQAAQVTLVADHQHTRTIRLGKKIADQRCRIGVRAQVMHQQQHIGLRHGLIGPADALLLDHIGGVPQACSVGEGHRQTI